MGSVHDISCYDRQGAVVEFTELAKQGLQTPQPFWMQTDRLPDWAAAVKRDLIRQGRARHEQMLKALEEAPKKKPAAG